MQAAEKTAADVLIDELDDEMAELLFHTVRKLESITDEAFAQLYIAPDSMMDD